MSLTYRMYAQRIFTQRWEESVDFYQNILQMPLEFIDNDIGWAEFDVGGVMLAVERLDDDDKEAKDLVGRFIGVSLQVDDIDEVYQELSTRGVNFTRAPEKQPWGGILADLSDPDGNELTLLGNAPN